MSTPRADELGTDARGRAARRAGGPGGEKSAHVPEPGMRLEFTPRADAQPLERLVDGFIFLSGGIFSLLDRLHLAADEHGFGGRVRIEVVARGLLDKALEPLASQYDAADLERAAEVLAEAIRHVGREFFAAEVPVPSALPDR